MPSSDEDIRELLEELESLAPKRETRERVSYRSTEEDEVVDDSLPPEALDKVDPEEREESRQESETEAKEGGDEGAFSEASEGAPVRDFEGGRAVPVAAVDCGFVRLGETENGVIIALRATLVIDEDGTQKVRLFRSGPVYLHYGHKLEILHQIGKQLGKEDLFVEMDRTDPADPKPSEVKSGAADGANKYSDRFRNWFERLVQRMAATSIENGVILLDGALTLRTRDTPDIFLERLARSASESGNAVIAISKQSSLQVDNKSIRFWLSDQPQRKCYRLLSQLMSRERSERVLGNTYAARFSPVGSTFRMDVKPVEGQTDREAISDLFGSTLMRSGYPDILVRAHAHSYFTSPHVTHLQAQAGAKYKLTPQPEAELTSIFGPFGGRFK